MHSPDGSYVGGSCQRRGLTGGGRWRRLVLLPGVSCLVPAPDAWASSQETTGACNMASLQASCRDTGYGKHTVTHQNTAPPPTHTHIPIPKVGGESTEWLHLTLCTWRNGGGDGGTESSCL